MSDTYPLIDFNDIRHKHLHTDSDVVDLCDYVDELEARIAELEAAAQWYPASEPPINPRTIILSITMGKTTFPTTGYCGGGKWHHPFDMCKCKVNCWCDLPRPPKTES